MPRPRHISRAADSAQPIALQHIAARTPPARRAPKSMPSCSPQKGAQLSESAESAIEFGAASNINIKPGRVAGFLEAKKIHDLCLRREVPVWCGGMLETGIGRAANVALAALPGFTLPGDTSASNRYYAEDVTEPFVLRDGRLAVPTGPGIGVVPIPENLRSMTVAVEDLTRP